MGIDKSLSDAYPSVIINGSKYHYGRTPDYNEYLVENAHIAKDYWCFKEKEDLEAFLVNLPESADRYLRLKLHPDWSDVTPEQRDAYFEQDKLLFRAMAAEKVKNGTAQSFNMDLEGQNGPHEPQRIENQSKEPPLARVERQIADYKAAEAVNADRAGYPIEPGEWPRGSTDTLKLRVLEGEIEWTGVAAKDKEAVLAREVDFAGITPEQFAFVYQDIAIDKMEPADPAVAQTLFGRSQAQAGTQPIRDTTRNLVESLMLDAWPRAGAIVDFGLKSQQHYEALYYPVREGEITPEQLDAALGKGEQLTELVNAAPHNPHQGIEFRTDWDDLRPSSGQDGNGGQGRDASNPQLPSPSEISDDPQPESADRGPVKTRGR
jgi:hypothetical protein